MGRGLGVRITFFVAVALALSFIANILYFSAEIRKEAYDSFRSKSRAVLLQAESSRNYFAALRGTGAFNDAALKSAFDGRLSGAADKVAAARETDFFKTVPIIAAMKIAGEQATQAGFKLRVPKVEARNKANEPDQVELELLDKIQKGNLPELFMVDKANNVIRYLRPIKLTTDCLVCHGVPSDTLNKDGLDLLGTRAEGWKAGEQHGAFEVLGDLSVIESSINHKILTSLGITSLVSMLALLFLMWVIRSIILRPLGKLALEMKQVAEGDLSAEVLHPRDDEIGQLASSVNAAVEKMRTTLTLVLESSCQVATAVGTLYAAAEEISTGAEEVAVQATKVATAGEEMAATSCDIASNCQRAAEGSRVATEDAHEGAEVVRGSISIMSQIADKVRASARTLTSLGARSEQIGQIVDTIEDIADQTNLLALNAAIEAARAGEQGRGFAVVADEVRALAERTTKATREIGEMIKAIQRETGDAVSAMNDGLQEVERGTGQATHSSEALTRILEEINNLGMQIHQIATAADEQTATTAEISGNMLRVNDIGKSVADYAHASARGAGHLNADAEALLLSLANFNLKESTPLILKKAKSAHLIFSGKIRAHLHGEQRVDPGALPTHLTCAFGKWYQGPGNDACGHLRIFREIDAPHAKVHELGRQAVQAKDAGDTAKADQYCHEMLATSQQLVDILDQLMVETK